MRIPTYFVRPASIRIYNDSKIRYATRVNFDVACKMEFQNYPLDEQICDIKLESLSINWNMMLKPISSFRIQNKSQTRN